MYAPAISTTGARIPACGPVIAPVTPTTYPSCAAAVPTISASAAALAISTCFMFPSSWSVLQYGACLSREELVLASIVHGVHQVPEALVHLLALHLARRCDRLAFRFGVERLRQNAEGLELLDAGELHVGALDLILEQRFHFGMVRKAGETAVCDVLAACPVRHRLEVDLDECCEVFARVTEYRHLGDIGARPQDILDIGRRERLAAGRNDEVARAI